MFGSVLVVPLGLASAQSNNAATGVPTITGTVQVGAELTASPSGIDDADGLTNVSYSYQWVQVDGSTAQMALFLQRALNLSAPTGANTFDDVVADHYARHAIEAIHFAGITTGCDTEPLRYCPREPINRAQMAAFISRALNLRQQLNAWAKPARVES